MANTNLSAALAVNAPQINQTLPYVQAKVLAPLSITASDGNDLDMTASTVSFEAFLTAGPVAYQLPGLTKKAQSAMTAADLAADTIIIDNTVPGSIGIAFGVPFTNGPLTNMYLTSGTVQLVIAATDSAGGNQQVVAQGNLSIPASPL